MCLHKLDCSYQFHNIINELGFKTSAKFVIAHSSTINKPEHLARDIG